MRPSVCDDDELLEVGRRVEPALQADRPLVELAFEPADRRRPGSATAAPARPAPTLTPDACRSRGRISTDQLALDAADQVRPRRRRRCRAAAA